MSHRLKKRKSISDLTPTDKGFVEGVAFAVAILIRADNLVQAEELWNTLGGLGDKVPRFITTYDAEPIRANLKTNWGRNA